MRLIIDQPSPHTIWIIKGSICENDSDLSFFHKLGISARLYKGNVFIMKSVKFLTKNEMITRDHIRLYVSLDGRHFSLDRKPTSHEEEVSPFGSTFRSMWEVKPINPILTKSKPISKPEPEPDPDSDSESSGSSSGPIGFPDIFE